MPSTSVRTVRLQEFSSRLPESMLEEMFGPKARREADARDAALRKELDAALAARTTGEGVMYQGKHIKQGLIDCAVNLVEQLVEKHAHGVNKRIMEANRAEAVERFPLALAVQMLDRLDTMLNSIRGELVLGFTAKHPGTKASALGAFDVGHIESARVYRFGVEVTVDPIAGAKPGRGMLMLDEQMLVHAIEEATERNTQPRPESPFLSGRFIEGNDPYFGGSGSSPERGFIIGNANVARELRRLVSDKYAKLDFDVLTRVLASRLPKSAELPVVAPLPREIGAQAFFVAEEALSRPVCTESGEKGRALSALPKDSYGVFRYGRDIVQILRIPDEERVDKNGPALSFTWIEGSRSGGARQVDVFSFTANGESVPTSKMSGPKTPALVQILAALHEGRAERVL